MPLKLITDADLSDKRVLLRLDLNLPVQDGVVTDFTRLNRSKATIKYVIEQGGQVVILSHFGRPGGKFVPEASFEHLVDQIANELKLDCKLLKHGGNLPLPKLNLEQEVAEVLIVDNTRFFAGETKGDTELAQELSNLGDVFCLDAFSVTHRAHISVTGLAPLMPTYAGLSLSAEVDSLQKALTEAERPSAAIVGGAKVSTKISVLENLIPNVDCLVVGGGMANTFLLAMGHGVGNSLVEEDQTETALQLLALAKCSGCDVILPVDVATNTTFLATDRPVICNADSVLADSMVLDFGPKSTQAVINAIAAMKTILWNGPLGAFELSPFDEASVAVAKEVARRCASGDLKAVAGGGDTLALLAQAGAVQDFTFCSTGGGAFLEWLEGKALPGLEMLSKGSA